MQDRHEKARTPNHRLREQRELRGWSHREVALQLQELFPGVAVTANDVRRWEKEERKPTPYYRTKLCVLFSATEEQLGFVPPTVKRGIIEAVRESGETPNQGKIGGVLRCSQDVCPFLKQAGQRGFSGSEVLAKELQKATHELEVLDMEEKKRELLKLLGTSIVFADAGTGYQRFVTILLDGDRLGLFQYEMDMRWKVYHRGNTIQAGQGLHLWLDELKQFAKEAPKNEQIPTLLNMSYQLHGSIFRDEMKYSEAHNAYRQAWLVADEFNNPELKSASLARRGVTFIQQKKPIDAVQCLEGALTSIEDYDLPGLKGYIYQALSEAHAMAQYSQESWSNIILAEQALQRKDEIVGVSDISSNITSVTSQKGVNAVLLKDCNQALTLLDTGLTKYDPTLQRGRVRLIAQRAEACYGLGLIDESTKTAMEALTIAQTIGSQKTIDRVRGLHLLLEQSRYKKETGVVQLGRMLTPM